MLNILVADDSEVVRQLLKAALSGVAGWTLCGEAADGQQAVALAHESKPDMIVMDLAMPLLDGLHAAGEILKFAPALPIILYTLHKTPEIELEAKKAGMRAVVAKSDDIQVLLGTIRELVSEHAVASPIEAMSAQLFTAAVAETSREPSASAPEVSTQAAGAAEGAKASAASASAGGVSSSRESAATAHGTAGALQSEAEAPSANGPKNPASGS